MTNRLDLFPRCDWTAEDGRRCWLNPGHSCKHVVAPAPPTTDKRLRVALSKIIQHRGDVPQDVLLYTWVKEQGTAGLPKHLRDQVAAEAARRAGEV